MSTGYAWTMMPAIRELYGEDEAKMKAGVKRHLEFFNCATTPSPFIIGITCAMEEPVSYTHLVITIPQAMYPARLRLKSIRKSARLLISAMTKRRRSFWNTKKN